MTIQLSIFLSLVLYMPQLLVISISLQIPLFQINCWPP
uniref:Uncharacterized protein n=1 Tax=Romanomermis culicivorax TaxID=13658 RepID=A0A915HHZ3_ROMCU